VGNLRQEVQHPPRSRTFIRFNAFLEAHLWLSAAYQ
jgi:hypothetical protein